MITHLSAGNPHLHLTASSRDDGVELLADATQETQTVVLGKGIEEVLDGRSAGAGLLGELGDDGGLVLGAERGSGKNLGELGVLLDDVAQGGEGLGRRLEGRRLGSGRVL